MASALAAQMRTLGMVFSMMLITVFLGTELGSEGLDAPNALGGLLSTMRYALGAISVLSLLALLTAWRDSSSTSATRLEQVDAAGRVSTIATFGRNELGHWGAWLIGCRSG